MRMEDTKKYTRAEVAQHNGKNNSGVWLIVKDGVYDVTKYINEHPGGRDTILEEAGKDATVIMEDHHPPEARKILTKYKIGELVEEDKAYDAYGKKKKKHVVAAQPEESRSCLNIVSCGLLG